MSHKYDNISTRGPKEAADIVGVVDKRNYLAHSIRDIEFAILRTQGKIYQISTYTSKTCQKSKIIFYDRGCEIRLTCECDNIDDRRIRLILAHELGHLVYNIDKLKNPEILENTKPSDEQEVYAWLFAYHLINKKSDEYKADMDRGKFIYTKGELKTSLDFILKNKKPEIYNSVIKKLPA